MQSIGVDITDQGVCFTQGGIGRCAPHIGCDITRQTACGENPVLHHATQHIVARVVVVYAIVIHTINGVVIVADQLPNRSNDRRNERACATGFPSEKLNTRFCLDEILCRRSTKRRGCRPHRATAHCATACTARGYQRIQGRQGGLPCIAITGEPSRSLKGFHSGGGCIAIVAIDGDTVSKFRQRQLQCVHIDITHKPIFITKGVKGGGLPNIGVNVGFECIARIGRHHCRCHQTIAHVVVVNPVIRHIAHGVGIGRNELIHARRQGSRAIIRCINRGSVI